MIRTKDLLLAQMLAHITDEEWAEQDRLAEWSEVSVNFQAAQRNTLLEPGSDERVDFADNEQDPF